MADDEAGEDADADAEPEPERPEPAEPGGPPREPHYEEVTLADLVITIYDHRRAAVGVFLAVLLVTVAVTGVQEVRAPDPEAQPGPDGGAGPNETTPEPEPTVPYRAEATAVLLHEQEAAVWVLRSPGLAADAASSSGVLAPSAGPSEAAATVQQVRENTTITREEAGAWTFATVEVVWTDPGAAADLAEAHVDALEDRRPLLENLTWAREWPAFHAEAADPNRTAEEQNTLARDRLSDHIAGLDYVRALEPTPPPEPLPPPDDAPDPGANEAEAAAQPTDPGPDWGLNLALGATLGAMLAFMTPFVLEAAANVREELQERRGV